MLRTGHQPAPPALPAWWPRRRPRAFPRRSWLRSNRTGLLALRYTVVVVGSGSLGDAIYDTVARSCDCARVRVVRPEHAAGAVCEIRPDFAIFCGPDRDSVLDVVREVIALQEEPPCTVLIAARCTDSAAALLAVAQESPSHFM